MITKKLFTHKMFLLLLFPILFLAIAVFVIVNTADMETWGMNKTVGWTWDIANSNFIQFFLYPVYLFGYGLLFLFKVRTNYRLSLLHFGLIIISAVIFSYSSLSFVTFCLTFLSFLVFITNIVYSITVKLKPKAIGLDKESA